MMKKKKLFIKKLICQQKDVFDINYIIIDQSKKNSNKLIKCIIMK